jgi:phospholipid transport system substrate-binding protein
MIRRRRLIAAGLLAGLPVFGVARRTAAQQPPAAPASGSDGERAIAFIRRSGQELAAIVHDPTDKRARLRAYLDRVVDVDGVARFCLGRFWNLATDAQRAAYTSIYHDVLMNAVLARVGSYGGPTMQLTFGHAEMRGDTMQVPTILAHPGEPPATVTWVLRMDGPAPRLVDLIVVGTSLRVTVRSDYTAFLNSHGDNIDALIAALRQQVAAAS